MMPAARNEIEDAVNHLRSAPLLRGYRGRPAADIGAAVDTILAVQDYALSKSGSLLELDVNPLLIGAEGDGVCAADALIVLQEQES